MIDPAGEIRALAGRALEDAWAEQRSAEIAVARAGAYLDKYHELMALLSRLSPSTKVEDCTIVSTRPPDVSLGGAPGTDD